MRFSPSLQQPNWTNKLFIIVTSPLKHGISCLPLLLRTVVVFQGSRLQVTCFAVGSRDKALSVWLIPNTDRPVVVLHRLFKHSILDFSWWGFRMVFLDAWLWSFSFCWFLEFSMNRNEQILRERESERGRERKKETREHGGDVVDEF